MLLHTNLGRAPLAHHQDARAQSLELDLATGERGSRQRAVGQLLARLCGAEAAMVVNNNAAAVLLVLAALAAGRAVPVSRGESVEIGGGFRVPEVMEQSGARLVDVGTTNRTRLDDYRRALGDRRRRGAGPQGAPEQLPRRRLRRGHARRRAGDARRRPSSSTSAAGCSTPPARGGPGAPPAWLAGEPAAVQTLAAGAALVTFSGDKLLGGPQAGIIAGRADLVERCARHPLARALRPGGLVLAALQDVALAYLRRDVVTRDPVLADGRDAGRRARPRGRDVIAAATGAERGRHRGAARCRVGARRHDPVVRRSPSPATTSPRCAPTTRRSSPGRATASRSSTCAPSSRPTTPSSPPPCAGWADADARRSPPPVTSTTASRRSCAR